VPLDTAKDFIVNKTNTYNFPCPDFLSIKNLKTNKQFKQIKM
jgi:hypothetical protein